MVTEKYLVTPQTNYDSKPYWEYLREHKPHLQKCVKCGRSRFPPAPSCPYCGTLSNTWAPISGKGTLYSWIVIHHPVDPRLASEVPFIVALVELEEGVRVGGRSIGVDRNQVKGGMPVKARYDDINNEFTLMNFEAGA